MRQEKQKDNPRQEHKGATAVDYWATIAKCKETRSYLVQQLNVGVLHLNHTHLRDFTPQRTMRFAEKNMVALPSREERQKPHKKEEASKMKQDNHSNTTVQREKPSGTNTRLGSGVPVKNPTN